MSLEPAILRNNLHHELATLLRNMIAQGALRPGNRIAEQQLCAQFGVSRTPLREALKVLSVEGLVHLLPNRGARVVHITRKEVEEIIPVLGALEILAGELACARNDNGAVAAIRTMHERMVEHYRNGEAQPYRKLNRSIHETIVSAGGNGTLVQTYNTIQTRLYMLTISTPDKPLRWAEAVEDHERMMVALETRDQALFAQTARRHMRYRAELFRRALDAQDAQADASIQ